MILPRTRTVRLNFCPYLVHYDWPDTWSQVHSMPLDRHVIDANWKISHGVIYTAERLVNFGMDVEPSCHCGAPLETPDERQAVPPVFSYVLNLCKFFLWLTRNNYRFRNTAPSVPDIITSVRQRLFFILPLFKKRFVSDTRKRKFNRCWNVLGKFWANPV
ncbi:hypothetical protein QZH41_015712 [Actinostola sp. cb2023]|nr:hypothetical protein QZH41_015712 [Actinostola sp. cb2023]